MCNMNPPDWSPDYFMYTIKTSLCSVKIKKKLLYVLKEYKPNKKIKCNVEFNVSDHSQFMFIQVDGVLTTYEATDFEQGQMRYYFSRKIWILMHIMCIFCIFLELLRWNLFYWSKPNWLMSKFWSIHCTCVNNIEVNEVKVGKSLFIQLWHT